MRYLFLSLNSLLSAILANCSLLVFYLAASAHSLLQGGGFYTIC